MIRKIAVTGPESTGKSMLAEQLAVHYKTVWVPEYAREYLDFHGPQYTENDILEIAKGQVANEEKILAGAGEYGFCDTELIVTKIWSEVKYKRCDPWILAGIENRPYDLFLLCDIDLPWQYDPLREHPDQRKFLFELYYQELYTRNLPFRVVNGIGPGRLTNAINIIDSFTFK